MKVNGRSKIVPVGKSVPPHVHFGALSCESESAREFVNVHKRLSKAGISSKVRSVGNEEPAINYINYCHKQSDSFHQYGNLKLNFKDYIYDEIEII